VRIRTRKSPEEDGYQPVGLQQGPVVLQPGGYGQWESQSLSDVTANASAAAGEDEDVEVQPLSSVLGNDVDLEVH